MLITKLQGVAVSFLSPLWPYDVSVNIAVDSGPPTFVNLLDPAYASHKASGGEETVASSSRWNVAGLANGIHKVVVSMPSNGKYVIVDGFMCVDISFDRCMSKSLL